MAGKHFCVSFADSRDAKTCLEIGQSVMWDNGAFTTYTSGKVFDHQAYYDWLQDKLGHPHWAVIPDVIVDITIINHDHLSSLLRKSSK